MKFKRTKTLQRGSFLIGIFPAMACFKVTHCCACIELRTGCIVLGIVGVILGIIGIGLNTTWTGIVGLIVALISNVCLLYGAISTNGSITSRTIALLIYIAFEVVSVIFTFVLAILVFVLMGDGGWTSEEKGILAASATVYLLACALGLYFIIVVFSYYQEIKGSSSGGALSAA